MVACVTFLVLVLVSLNPYLYAQEGYPLKPILPLRPPPRTLDGKSAAEVVNLSAHTQAAVQTSKYKLILTGQLDRDLVIEASQSPVLIQGILVIPKNRTLFLKPGVEIHIRPGRPSSSQEKTTSKHKSSDQVGQLWCLGKILADGLTGKDILIQGAPDERTEIFFYGQEQSELRGVNLTWISVTQNAGSVQWIACRLAAARHYALSSGAAVFLHCDFNRLGGIMATYDNGQWGLIASHCRFNSCGQGVVFATNPGADALIIDHNNFINTDGPVFRAWPLEPKNKKKVWQEFLIGENWYGTNIPEQIDARIHDYRTDRALKARINTRAPAEAPFKDTGANVSAATLTNSYHALSKKRTELIASIHPVSNKK